MAASNECIICFNETYSRGNRVIINMEVDDIQRIVKKCSCKFKVHETCFLKWIRKKPVCPFCRENILIKPRDPKFTIIKSGCERNLQSVKALVISGLICSIVLIIVVSGG